MNAEAYSFSAAGTMYAILNNTFSGNAKRPISKSELHNLLKFMKNREKMFVELDAVKSEVEKEYAQE